MSESFGASFSIDVSQLKAGLQQANRLIKESKSEFKAAAAGMDDWTKSEAGLTAKLDSLNKIASVQKEKVNALQKEYDRLIDEGLDPTSAQAVKLRTDINEQKAALNSTQKEVDKYTNELEDMQSETGDASESADDLTDSIDDAGNAADGASDGFTVMKAALADLVADGIRLCVDALKDFISSTLDVGKTFDSSMSKVAALSGATEEDLAMLRDTAKEFGSTTQFSASEAADALGYMALAGWDAKESASGLGGVLNLAAASGMELAEASDMVTDYLSAFGLEAKDSAYFADLLAYAQANANTTAQGLGEAFKNCAANMNAAGQDVETTTALLSMLANQGLKGSEAGTALAAVLRDITAKMEKGAIQIGKTSIAVMDANGNYRDMTDILKDVEAATDGMGDAEKAVALQSTFTADSIKGLNLLLNAGVDSAADFEDELRKSTGAAEDMAKVMQDNLAGDLTSLSSKFDGVKIALYERFEPALRSGVDALSAIIDAIGEVDVSGFAEKISGAFDAFINDYLPKIVNGFNWIKDNWEYISAGIAAIGAAFVAFKVVTLIQSVTAALEGMSIAQAALNLVMSMNPIGLLIAAIAGLVTAFVVLWNKSEEFRNFWINLWEQIQNAAKVVLDWLQKAFANAWTAIKNAWSGVKKFFADIWTGIKNTFANVSSYFSGIFSSAWHAIQSAWSNVVSFFSGIWTGIQNAFSAVASWFGGIFSQAWANIKNAFAEFGSFFGGLWDTVKQKFTDFGSMLGDAIGGAVKSGINGAITLIENTINKGIDMINGAIDLINKIPGVSIGKFSNVSLPRLEKGGVVSRATAAIVGENGAEAIMPLEKNTGWIKQLAKEIAAEQNHNAVVVNQTNNYSQAHSRYEIYKSKQQTAAAVRLALAGV